jgi:DNA modification methylase
MTAPRCEQLSDDVQVWLGDCREVLPLVGRIDVVVTDPPYGIAWKRGVNKARNSKAHDGILNDGDTTTRDDALAILGDIPSAVFGSFYAPFPEDVKQVLVWHKPADSGLVGSVTGFRRDAEPIFLTGRWPVRTVVASSVLKTDGGQAAVVTETGHPHTKPLGLMRQLVKLTPGAIVCDPFMGSGSTGVAAVQLNRGFVGVELDPRYFATACRRISDELSRPRLPLDTPAPKPVQEVML